LDTLKTLKKEEASESKKNAIIAQHMKLTEMRITQLSETAQRRILKILDDSLYEEENGNSNYYIGGVLCNFQHVKRKKGYLAEKRIYR
jgi:hypothetical protein